MGMLVRHPCRFPVVKLDVAVRELHPKEELFPVFRSAATPHMSS